MARRKTTPDDDIRALEPREAPYSVGYGKGLSLLIQPNGSKWWRFRYRISGKSKMLSVGVWPDISHGMAIERRDQMRRLVADDIDPSKVRKAKKVEAKTAGQNTFAAIAKAWHNEPDRLALAEHTRYNISRRLELDINPHIGKTAITELTSADIREVIRVAKARGVLDTAQRIGAIIREVCAYAEDQGAIVENNPAASVRVSKIVRKPPSKHHAAIVRPREFGKLMKAIYKYSGAAVTTSALKLIAHTFVRPENVREMRWKDINFRSRLWIIADDELKKKPGIDAQEHIVPLSRQAIEILKQSQTMTGHLEFVHPNQSKKTEPMSENTMNKALRTMGFNRDTHVSHGFRASARTMLDEQLKFRPDVIEHQLGHVVRDPNGNAYNRTCHIEERKVMMQSWSDYIDQLRSGNNKVVAIGERAA